jgi:hypothetical protein
MLGHPTIGQGNYWTSCNGIIAWFTYVQAKCPICPTYHALSCQIGKFGHLVQVGQGTCKGTVKTLAIPKIFHSKGPREPYTRRMRSRCVFTR